MQAHPCVEAGAYCTPLLSLSGPILNCLSPPHGFYSIRSMVNPTCHTSRWPVACPSASLPSLTFTQSDNKATFACHTRILESPPSTFCLNFLLIRIPAAIRSPGQTWYTRTTMRRVSAFPLFDDEAASPAQVLRPCKSMVRSNAIVWRLDRAT